MTTGAYVDGFSYALGTRRLSVEESVAAGRTITSAADLIDAGFAYHHVCGEDESAYELALRASTPIGGEDLDAIVYATCIPANANLGDPERFVETGDVKHLMDFPASRLQAELGASRAIVLGLNQQACTGMLGSVRLAGALLAAEPDMRKVLCVTADRFPPGAVYEQAYSLISDGAAACVVTRAPAAYRLIAVHQISNGAMVMADDDETVGAYFSYTHRLVSELVQKAATKLADVDWVVPQNTNVKAWEVMARLLGVDPDRVQHPSLPDVGHVISGDNVVNLAYLEAAGIVGPGNVVLVVMAGYGMNWQGLLLERS